MKPIPTKWPGGVIVGKSLTPEQVIDVVFNTITIFSTHYVMAEHTSIQNKSTSF